MQKSFNMYAKPMVNTFIIQSLMFNADRIIAAVFVGGSTLIATNLVLPFLIIAGGIAQMIASGFGAFIGLQQQTDKVGKYISFYLVVTIIFYFFLTILFLIFNEQIITLLGASVNNDIFIKTQIYFIFVVFTQLPIFIYSIFSTLMLNVGFPKIAARIKTIPLILNLLLSIFFVIFLDMGVVGLGLSTLVASIVASIVAIYYFIHEDHELKLVKPEVDVSGYLKVLYNGSSEFISMSSDAIVIIIINIALIHFTDLNTLTAYAYVSTLTALIFMPYLGVMYGMQPLFSKLYSEKKYQHVRELLIFNIKKSIPYAIVIYIIMLIILFFVAISGINSEIIRIVIPMFILTGLGYILSFVSYEIPGFFTSIGNPKNSLLISAFRNLLLLPTLLISFIYLFGGIGVGISYLISEVVMIIFVGTYVYKMDLSKIKSLYK